MVDNKTTPKKNPWIYEHKFSEDNPTTLICFPYAGGNTHAYSSWCDFLPDDWNLLAIQYPGRLSLMGYPPEKDITKLVDQLYPFVAPYLGSGKIIFFGHSLGALVSYELAKRVETQGNDPIDALYVSACVSPDLVGKEEGIHHLSDDDFLTKISGYGGTPKEILQDKELMNFFLPVLKSDFCLYETYPHRPREKVSCPLIAMGSPHDPYAPIEGMNNWSQQTQQPQDLITVTGDHFYLHDPESNFATHFCTSLNQLFPGEVPHGS